MMKHSRRFTIGLLAIIAVGLLLLLAWSNRMFQAAQHQDSGINVAASRRETRLTTSDEDKILIANLATVPFRELYDLLEKRTPNEMAVLARRLQDLPPGGVTDAKIVALFKAWSALDAKAAFSAATTFKTSSQRVTAIEAVLDGCEASAAGSMVAQLWV